MPRSTHVRPFAQTAALAALLTVAGASCAPASPGAAAATPGAPITVSRTDQVSGTTALLIAVSAPSEQVAWASGARGTVIRTTDGGAHWTAMQVPGADSLQFRDIHALDDRIAWVLSIGNGEQSRLYRTVDGGATWERQFTNRFAEAFKDCIEFWDIGNGLMIGDAIGNEIDLLRTENGGRTWIRVPLAALPPALTGEGSFAASGTCIAMQPRGRAWIIMNTPTTSRLIRTSDYGRTWAVETLPITTHEGSGAQSVIFRDARVGMVLGGGYATKPGDTLIAVTEDGGATWTPRTVAPPFKVGTWGGSFVRGARVPTVVAVGPSGSAWSSDLGRSWVPIDTLNYWSVGFSPARVGWAVGQRGRVTRLGGW